MATVILAAAGAAIGGSIGGTVAAGITTAAVGRFAGATVGKLIDQSLLGGGADVVETGKVERFRLTGSAEGAAQARVFGRVRLPGQVIWATRFLETVTETEGGGGKGRPSQPKTVSYSYSVSLAIALCEGEIARVGRVWADGIEISPNDLTLRVHYGTGDQLPDPKIEAVEGSGAVPAFRGTAYVVIEDLELAPFGNRVPQFSFEVVRPTPKSVPSHVSDYAETVRAVALMPGTGEYALAETPVYLQRDGGETRAANENTPSGKADLVTSIDALTEELPNCKATSLIVSWFGDDLRVGHCTLRPKVEQSDVDGEAMPWRVAGVNRSAAQEVAKLDGRPVYGGTPSDASVIQAIRHLQGAGQEVMFYPFILMEQLADNGRADPWSDDTDQPVLPWRGRITLSKAPGQTGSPDGTATAEGEVATFFGTARAVDFQVSTEGVSYAGPDEWSYRRFILHNAALCAAAGGVDAFCIGSEMRSLTQIRGAAGFPAVTQLIALAAEVRALLGPSVKIGYAADWSEYFGYQPQDGSGDVYFHLDPLWADDEIDFIGIDNYMPLSDWRDDVGHIDGAIWDAVHNIEYLKTQVAGGEGYDWYYPSQEARDAQARSPIEDGAYGEPWVFRYKDIKNWWSNPHHDRVAGMRQTSPTDWIPGSKPIWFTEIGCAAIDRGTNQPNKFLDEKSSESALPYYSRGIRDDLMQQSYLQALHEYWNVEAHNPLSDIYDAPMLDTARMFAWAWDARPFPAFPNERNLWTDGGNYAKGHWLNGRATNRTLAAVVEEICVASGVAHYDVSGLYGVVRGYVQADVADGRAALQPLMLRHGFDAFERDGVLHFAMRGLRDDNALTEDKLALSSDIDGDWELSRTADAELAGRVRLNFTLAERDFDAVSEEAILHDEASFAVSQSEVPEVMTRGEGRQTAERWLAEARVARDRVKLALPPSRMDLGAGDVVTLAHTEIAQQSFRLDRVAQQGAQVLEGARVERAIYRVSEAESDPPRGNGFRPPVPVRTLFLDVPLMTGDEIPHAPHIACTANPWPGRVAVYASDTENGYTLDQLLESPATIGITRSPLLAASAGRLDKGAGLDVELIHGALQSVSDLGLLNGGNLSFVGDGASDNWEAIQFQRAELIGPNRFRLSGRLRGQLGTEGNIHTEWPEGSYVVFVSEAITQLNLPRRYRGALRNYRVGPAQRALSDATYRRYTEAFDGIGLRPYAPVHLRITQVANGALAVRWIRRTRIDGDNWDGLEVPLGEETEAYLLRVYAGDALIREEQVSVPAWTYAQEMQSADGFGAEGRIEVAQISAVFGPGRWASISV
ncbi:glycoside hydrolase/phage tail family protein [Shimia sp. R10_1]|uniref:baseplate multidomain protein megatron n=1 Tax=Shimia sp. R10_1 TaxID=2821095 RepID=UPI001ADC5FB8|nr:glycoside hydrolase/phage tail family protein [Shimia sp. R10_1]MBO9472029.1 glycoside hydrolase/phage tail family protein [Shimia sp. R10_1]